MDDYRRAKSCFIAEVLRDHGSVRARE